VEEEGEGHVQPPQNLRGDFERGDSGPKFRDLWPEFGGVK
jgi:hypothetical protein